MAFKMCGEETAVNYSISLGGGGGGGEHGINNIKFVDNSLLFNVKINTNNNNAV